MITFSCSKCKVGMANSEDEYETVARQAEHFFREHKCDKIRLFLNELQKLSKEYDIYIVSEVSGAVSLVNKDNDYIDYGVTLDISLGRYFIK